MKLRGLVPNFHIHVSVGNLYSYIPTICSPILLNVEIRNEDAQFHFWEYIIVSCLQCSQNKQLTTIGKGQLFIQPGKSDSWRPRARRELYYWTIEF
jgi:hypothetical protein